MLLRLYSNIDLVKKMNGDKKFTHIESEKLLIRRFKVSKLGQV
jgi:hypothetical protein